MRAVCVGASAGGVEALLSLLTELEPGFTGAVLVVLHSSRYSALPQIINRRSRLPAFFAVDGRPIRPGEVLVAPPDQHLLINDHHVVLSRGPRQNNFRPAIDPLFKSAARTFGPDAVGVVLSGALDDGSAGLARIQQAGGMAIVQDPADAAVPEMPRNALAAVKADYTLSAADIGRELNRMMRNGHRKGNRMNPAKISHKEREAQNGGVTDPAELPSGKISTLTCPECGGTLWEHQEGRVLRFLCHIGHGYSADSLSAAQQQAVENGLWVAMRILKERGAFVERLIRVAQRSGERQTIRRYRAEESLLKQRIRVLRNLLVGGTPKQGPGSEKKLED